MAVGLRRKGRKFDLKSHFLVFGLDPHLASPQLPDQSFGLWALVIYPCHREMPPSIQSSVLAILLWPSGQDVCSSHHLQGCSYPPKKYYQTCYFKQWSMCMFRATWLPRRAYSGFDDGKTCRNWPWENGRSPRPLAFMVLATCLSIWKKGFLTVSMKGRQAS